jgi:hypothetical protein
LKKEQSIQETDMPTITIMTDDQLHKKGIRPRDQINETAHKIKTHKKFSP